MKKLCLKKVVWTPLDEQELWMDLNEKPYKKEIKLLPLYDHPHSDRENGQDEVHYHQDSRFKGDNPKDFSSYRNGRIALPLIDNEALVYEEVNQIRDVEMRGTPAEFIKNSKLKHKCIHKGKCPHRGFDLTDVRAINGVITCPLHSLKFNAKTKRLIK